MRNVIWKWAATLAYWTGAVPAICWLRRKLRPRSWTILAYHRIGSGSAGGGPDLVRPERFRRHLRYLMRKYEILPIGEAVERVRSESRLDRPLLSITFDDGYRDNFTTALPILLEEGCKATLYASVEAVRDGVPPWPHRLGFDLLGSGRSPADVSRIQAVARVVSEAQREEICEEAAIRSSDAGSTAAEMMSVEELREWRRSGMEVGSHTLTHRILARLGREERLKELGDSRRWLEEVLGEPVRHLAYPNGRSGDWDAATVEDAQDAGYRTAVTTVEGINAGSALGTLTLRRISIGDDPIPVFAARVSGLFASGRRWLTWIFESSETEGRNVRSSSDARPSSAPLCVAFIGGRGIGAAYSGIERYYEEVGSRLADRGHRVIAYCRSHFTPRIRFIRGIEVRRLPTLRMKHLETFIHTLLATVDVCFRRVDIVQFHALGSSPFAWLPRLAGMKTIVSVRGLDWQRAKWGGIARLFLRTCEVTSIYAPSATVVVSKTLERHFRERFGWRVRYIPNGVGDAEPTPAREIISRWGLEPRRYFLYAGRLSPEKRLDVLLEAHHSLENPVDLVLAGGSSYSGAYIKRLRKMASSRVKFTGFITGRPLQELYSNALAFVIPSQMEGLSVAILEALGYGLPVVASDIPETRELVQECGGFLVPVGDAAALADVLRRLAADPELARRTGERARARVREMFDWDRITLETERFYLEVAGRRATGMEVIDAEITAA